jgi:TetR/AcrR family transcriptional regulator, cholesterol catabolism regulator
MAEPRNRESYTKRRNEIIDAAAKVFAIRGFHETSIDDLVDATKLQRGGLYHYIGGKRELLLSIHERFIEPLLEVTRTILESNEAPDVKLREIAHVLMRTIDAYQPQVTVFLHEWRVIKDDPEWKGVRAARREFEQAIEQILADGRDAGAFEFGDARLATLGFLGMMNYTHQWFTPRGRVSSEELADAFTDFFLYGISG